MSRADPDHGLRALLHKNLREVHWQAVETGAIAEGVPDSNGCVGGVEFWVECKWTDAWRVSLSPSQISWLLRRTRAGGRCTVLVWQQRPGGPRRGPPLQGLYAFPGSLAGQVAALGLRRGGHLATAVFYGPPSGWDWGTLLRVLLSA